MRGLLIVLVIFCLHVLQIVTDENVASKSLRRRPTRHCIVFSRKLLENRSELIGSKNCLGETYWYGHQIDFRNECSVEPEDGTLSYVDSFWMLYRCIVQKSIGNAPLTQLSYAEMMIGNLSSTTKSAILSTLGTVIAKGSFEPITTSSDRRNNVEEYVTPNTTTTVIENARVEIENIKSYWKNFFGAEFEVCAAKANLNETCNNATMEKVKSSWIPGERCARSNMSSPFPYIEVSRPRQSQYLQLAELRIRTRNITCFKSLNESDILKNETRRFSTFLYFFWWNILTEVELNLDEMCKPVDFESFYYNNVVPKFYSKSAKQHVFEVFRDIFSQMFSRFKDVILNSDNVKDIFSYSAQHLELKMTKADPRRNTNNQIFEINVRILEALLFRVKRIVNAACPSSRMYN